MGLCSIYLALVHLTVCVFWPSNLIWSVRLQGSARIQMCFSTVENENPPEYVFSAISLCIFSVKKKLNKVVYEYVLWRVKQILVKSPNWVHRNKNLAKSTIKPSMKVLYFTNSLISLKVLYEGLWDLPLISILTNKIFSRDRNILS